MCRSRDYSRPNRLQHVGGPAGGYGENLEHARHQEAMVGELVGGRDYQCVNDVEVGWAGSLACKPGLHMVAGTGSIGFGRDPQGCTARCGGAGGRVYRRRRLRPLAGP